MSTFRPTHHQTRKAMRKATRITTDAPPRDENKLEEEPGSMKAEITKIDLAKINEKGWQVKYESTGEIEYVEMSSQMGVSTIPEGKTVNGFLYPTETIYVDVVQDSTLKKKVIVSTRTTQIDPNAEPGTTTIAQGESKVDISKSGIVFSEGADMIDYNVLNIPTSEALSANDVVNIYPVDGKNQCRKACATSYTTKADGFVKEAYNQGEKAKVYVRGMLVFGGLKIGSEYFLSETPGAVTSTPPTTTGFISQLVGVAVSSTQINFIPGLTMVRS